jgi:hypothetical protein
MMTRRVPLGAMGLDIMNHGRCKKSSTHESVINMMPEGWRTKECATTKGFFKRAEERQKVN